MNALTGKTAIVTGGSSGIGFAIAHRFVAEGAHVYITGRRTRELEAAASSIGGNIVAVAGDISEALDLSRLLEQVHIERGGLDLLVLNAAAIDAALLENTTDAHIDHMFAVNVRSSVLAVKAASSMMSAGSSIVVIGSTAHVLGLPALGAYAASKAALRSFVRTWTKELAPIGIRVNMLSPGPTRTPAFEAADDAIKATVVGNLPLGRAAEPAEIAAAALFLASPESSFVAGIDLCVDGGQVQV